MHSVRLAFLLLVCLPAAGCGSSDRPETVPVAGQVLVGGKSIEGATVTFRPTEKTGRPAFGMTDAEGNFVLSTFDDGDGAIPGEYNITIEKVKPKQEMKAIKTPAPPQPGEKVDYSDYMKAMSGTVPAADPTGDVPPKYSDEETSGLRRNVDPAGDNQFTFELTP